MRLFHLLFLLSVFILDAAEVSYRFSTDEIRLGEPVTLTYEIIHSESETLLSPPAPTGSPEVFITPGESVKKLQGSKTLQEFPFRIQFFSLDKTVINPVEFNFSGGARIVIPTTEITVHGVISAGDSQEIRDIKPPFTVRIHRKLLFRLVAAILLLFLLMLSAYYLYRRLYQKSEPVLYQDTETSLLPYEEAVRCLKQAEALIREDRKLLYFSLDEILRRYFSRSFHVHLLEKPLSEVIRTVPDTVPESLKNELVSLLCSWEMIKFARAETTVPSAEKDFHQTEKLIEDCEKFLEGVDDVPVR